MKMYFTAEELHTPEYKEYVKWVGECWRLNDECNRQIQAEIKHMEDLYCIAEIESVCYK